MHSEQFLYFTSSVLTTVVNHLREIPKQFNHILVIKLDEIGDMVYTLHCLHALKKYHPESEITVYCKSICASLLKDQNLGDKHVTSLNDLHTSFDLILDLRGNWKTLWFTFNHLRAFRFDRGTIRMRNKIKGKQEHEVRTNWDTILPILPINAQFENPKLHSGQRVVQRVKSILDEHACSKYAIIHCGARDAARRWSITNFAELVKDIGKTYDLPCLLVGAKDEYGLNEEVCLKLDDARVINLAGQTTLSELGELCANAEFFVGNESGPLHFASVMKTPLVALFGPGVKDVFYPLYPNQAVIHYFKDGKHTDQTESNSTMRNISVSEAKEALLKIYPPTISRTV